jgi:hypothetical protein
MDFNRSGQPRNNNRVAGTEPTVSVTPTANATSGTKPAANNTNNSKQPGNWHSSKLFRGSFIALLFSATLLFVAMLLYIVFGVPVSREAKFVHKDEMQAVFVNVDGTSGGQVYFGHITDLNNQFIRLTNVFYIQNQQGENQQTAYNLVKLGCELHGPQDEMIINRGEVFFWENLKSSSQVSQKAAEFVKQNPNGQKCSETTNTTEQSNTTTQTPTTTTPPTGGATTTPPAATGGTGTGTTNGSSTNKQ